MKTIYFIPVFVLLAAITNAQDITISSDKKGEAWTREARTSLYNNCLNKLGSLYSSVSEQDRKTISQCYMTEVEGKYKKSDFEAKIDIELEQIFESTVELCAQKAGVRLNKKIDKKAGLARKDLVGNWDSEAGRFYLYNSGEYTMNYLGKKKAERGTWALTGTVLRLNKKGKAKKGREFKINLYAGESFTFQDLKKRKRVYTANKIGN